MKQEERRNYMEKILFACDLDNTLIHSWRHRKSGDVCIEHIGEKEQGYMSPKAAELYRSLPENILLVPVTTRSVDQYRRIEWPGNREPELAVTTNGAILLGRKDVLRDGITGSGLRDGQGEDSGGGTVQQDSGDDLSGLIRGWTAASKSASALYRRTMDELLDILSASGHYLRVRYVDDFYLFAYCEEGVNPMDAVPESAFRTGLHITASGRKIYFLPPMFSKGEAVRKLRNLLRPPLILAAGDTEIDLSMAEHADIMFIPGKLFEACRSDMPLKVREKLRVCPEGADFSEFLLREAGQMRFFPSSSSESS